MKSISSLFLSALLVTFFFTAISESQTGYNAVLEYCTGTWNGSCPCAETTIDLIKSVYPNTMILGYHGPINYGDPWAVPSQPMIALFGFNTYPSGVVSRLSSIIGINSWENMVALYNNSIEPGCDIAVNNYNYNANLHSITANVVSTARATMTGSFYIMMVLTEDNLVYPQTGNSQCPGSSTWVHKNVVKGLINGAIGTLLNTTFSNWTSGTSVTTPLNYVFPAGVVDTNCYLNIFIYYGGAGYSNDCKVQQSTIVPAVTGPNGIIVQSSSVPAQFGLSQNYPNPFNPSTNIHFTLPKDGDVSLKVYDMLGNVVDTYSDGFLKAGTYNAEVDASNWASGIYFYTLRAGNFVETKKMTLVK